MADTQAPETQVKLLHRSYSGWLNTTLTITTELDLSSNNQIIFGMPQNGPVSPKNRTIHGFMQAQPFEFPLSDFWSGPPLIQDHIPDTQQ